MDGLWGLRGTRGLGGEEFWKFQREFTPDILLGVESQLDLDFLFFSVPFNLESHVISGISFPDFIDQHLKSIRARLFRRRLALLQEIVSEAGDPAVEQIRSPDTLYAFPQSLEKMAPRMGRYLELIFSVGSQWSCKPLFFRGIYFTSSMREGSALDEDLAESLGMSVDALPDGRA